MNRWADGSLMERRSESKYSKLETIRLVGKHQQTRFSFTKKNDAGRCKEPEAELKGKKRKTNESLPVKKKEKS